MLMAGAPRPSWLGQTFHHQGISLPTTGPHRGHTVPQTPILEGVQERHEDPGSTGPDGMADGDRSAMDVDPRVVELQFPLTGDDLDSKRLVDLEQVDVLHLESSLLYGLSRRRDRAHRHEGRLHVGPAPGTDEEPGPQAQLLRLAHRGH